MWRWCLAPRPADRAHRKMELRRKPVLLKFMTFAELLLAEDTPQLLDPCLRNIFASMKEVMLSGDANRLVAELTQVQVDDLASPLPKADFSLRIEPWVATAIMLNGIAIGIQASIEDEESQRTWYFVNLIFTVFFFAEIITRMSYHGCKRFLFGSDMVWNWFDGIIVLMAVVDSGLEMYTAFAENGHKESGPFTILRLIRLTRLSRLFRIFRLTFMRELSLMVKGLLAGVKTLACAMVLLFFSIYVIAVFSTSTLKPNRLPEIDEQGHFDNVFYSMFTVYRCLTSDCSNAKGESLTKKLQLAYGWPFVLCYVAFSIFVTFGIFNLIVAIYIESTLSAARMTEDRDKVQRKRESLRVAQHTKELLKKFCAAQRMGDQLIRPDPVSDQEVKAFLSCSSYEDVKDLEVRITKQVFLTALQDPTVQVHMDELDLPPDRVHLFDILDADGSGGLEVRELITGFLKVRGEARKSDAVASLLAVRAVQDMIRQLEAKVLQSQSALPRDSLQKDRPRLKSLEGIAVAPPPSETVCKDSARSQQAIGVREPPEPIRRRRSGNAVMAFSREPLSVAPQEEEEEEEKPKYSL